MGADEFRCVVCGDERCSVVTHAAANAREDERRNIAKWIRSSTASAMFGSESWPLRQSLAKYIERGIHEHADG